MEAPARSLSMLLAVLTLASTGTGCVTPRSLSSDAVSYNLAVEEAQNRVLLLNVLRAQHRHPMYLTAISKVTGSVTSQLGTTLTIPFSGDENTGGLGATYTLSPSFDIAVLDTKEFMQGFLAPIPAEVFAYYLHQGWPEEFLFHLLVRKIDVTRGRGKGAQSFSVSNYPAAADESLCEWKRFAEVVSRLLQRDIELKTVSVQVGPRFTNLTDLSRIIEADKQELVLERVPERAVPGGAEPEAADGRAPDEDARGAPPRNAKPPGEKGASPDPPAAAKTYRVRRAEGDVELVVIEREGREAAPDPLWPAADPPREGLDRDSARKHAWPEKWPGDCDSPELRRGDAGKPRRNGMDEGKPLSGTVRTEVGPKDVKAGPLAIRLYLRSPEAVLYYLGELVRVAAKQDQAPVVCIQGELEPLFFAREAGFGCAMGAVDAEYLGRRYLIPYQPRGELADTGWAAWTADVDSGGARCEGRDGEGEPWSVARWEGSKTPCTPGRSMHSLSLLSQLFALQKSAEDLPSTSLVRVVGQ